MAAAYATLRVTEGQGRVKSIIGYFSDTSNVLAKWDESKLANSGSPDFYTVKAPGSIFDLCFTTDLATPTHVQILINGSPMGDIMDVTAILASVYSRPVSVIPVKAGDRVQIMQIA